MTTGNYFIKTLRILLSIAVFALVSWVALAVLSPLSVGPVWDLIDRFLPAISAVTENINTDDWGDWLMLPLAIAAGLTCGAFVWDPKVTTKTEAVITPIVFLLLIAVSSVNFWSHDNLINVNAQAVIDVFLSLASLSLMFLLLRWKPNAAIALHFNV